MFTEPQIGAVMLVPPDALRTEESRGLLPEQAMHTEATLEVRPVSVMLQQQLQLMIGRRQDG